jgi:hypothetical protein
MTPDEILAALRQNARDTAALLGNDRKAERERSVCAAFLRCAGIDFRADQLVSSETEPPDVLFGDARFEVTIVLPPGRRMHADWKRRLRDYVAAKSLAELIEPYVPPRTITLEELLGQVMPAASQKGRRNAKSGVHCDELDLLGYVNDAIILDPASPLPDPALLAAQGWRSVSVLVPPHAWTVSAGPSAPQFLRDLGNRPVASHNEPLGASLFELSPAVIT